MKTTQKGYQKKRALKHDRCNWAAKKSSEINRGGRRMFKLRTTGSCTLVSGKAKTLFKSTHGVTNRLPYCVQRMVSRGVLTGRWPIGDRAVREK